MEYTDLRSMPQQNLPEDRQIVRLFFQRSEKAITYTRQKYGSLCSSVARRIFSDSRDAEECVNDTYLHACRRDCPGWPTASWYGTVRSMDCIISCFSWKKGGRMAPLYRLSKPPSVRQTAAGFRGHIERKSR